MSRIDIVRLHIALLGVRFRYVHIRLNELLADKTSVYASQTSAPLENPAEQ